MTTLNKFVLASESAREAKKLARMFEEQIIKFIGEKFGKEFHNVMFITFDHWSDNFRISFEYDIKNPISHTPIRHLIHAIFNTRGEHIGFGNESIYNNFVVDACKDIAREMQK